MTERELIEGCLNKNRDCEKTLFDRYAGKMMSVCLRYGRDEMEAQDYLQEGFIRVYKYLHQFRHEGSFEGWMRRVFVAVALRNLQKTRIHITNIDVYDLHEEKTDPLVLAKLDENEIHRMIRELPDGYRTVFNLYVIEGFSHDEIAGMMGIQPSTSRGQLLRAKRMLQQMIKAGIQQIKTIAL